jgi:2-dehydropantoate 2-reductase
MIDQRSDTAPRICVFGAGAIGGYVAGRLAQGGATVSMVARGETLAAIRARGLRVTSSDGEITARVAASDDPRELGPQDIVVVTVKSHSLPEVAGSIRPLLGPTTAIVFLMNGVPWWYFHGSHAEPRLPIPQLDAMAAPWIELGAERAIGGVIYPACTVTAPGVVYVDAVSKGAILGEPDGEISGRVTMLADILRAGGLPAEITSRIRDSVWLKLVNNLASGPLAILALSTAREIYMYPPCLDAARRSREEAAAIARAMGYDVARGADAQLPVFGTKSHKSSIVQDLERGRTMEIDALYSIPLEMARHLAVATPTLDLLVDLVKLRARAAGLYA